MGSRASVTDTDKGAEALLKRLASKLSLTVGIHEEEGSTERGGATLAEIGFIHDQGLGNVPARPWLSGYVDGQRERIRADLRELGGKMLRPDVSPEAFAQEAEVLGAVYVGEIQRGMSDGIPPPLQQRTIDRKGSSVPLIDTGALRSSVTYKVTTKG